MDLALTCKVEGCKGVFREARYLQEHIRRYHGLKQYQCSHCHFSSRYKCLLKTHIEERHLRNKRIKLIDCCLCRKFKGSSRKCLISHYTGSHDVDVNPQSMVFANADDFETWKSEVEKNVQVRFVCERGARTSGKVRSQMLKCFRDGFFSTVSTGKRKLKRMGSNKIGGLCPAYIKKSECTETGVIKVEYVSVHVGHTAELGRLTLPKKQVSLVVNPEEKNENLFLHLPEENISTDISVGELSKSEELSLNFGKRKQQLHDLFLSILKKAVTEDHLEVLHNALTPVLPTFSAMNLGLKFKPRSGKPVNTLANISPQKSIFSTKAKKEMGQQSMRKPSED